jgi:hypothetical protein
VRPGIVHKNEGRSCLHLAACLKGGITASGDVLDRPHVRYSRARHHERHSSKKCSHRISARPLACPNARLSTPGTQTIANISRAGNRFIPPVMAGDGYCLRSGHLPPCRRPAKYPYRAPNGFPFFIVIKFDRRSITLAVTKADSRARASS